MVSLVKSNSPGSLRQIASWYSGFGPSHLQIAGRCREAILSKMNCEGLAIARISINNAFVVRDGEFGYYVFVRPDYTGYRALARHRFGCIPADHDVDHVLARNLAIQLNYHYVLLALLPKSVNRTHGSYERRPSVITDVPETCAADVRVFDKILARLPTSRRARTDLCHGFDPCAGTPYGLAANQRGLWNIAFGFDRLPPAEFMRRLKPL